MHTAPDEQHYYPSKVCVKRHELGRNFSVAVGIPRHYSLLRRFKASRAVTIGMPSTFPSASMCFLSPETIKSAFPVMATAKIGSSLGSGDRFTLGGS